MVDSVAISGSEVEYKRHIASDLKLFWCQQLTPNINLDFSTDSRISAICVARALSTFDKSAYGNREANLFRASLESSIAFCRIGSLDKILHRGQRTEKDMQSRWPLS